MLGKSGRGWDVVRSIIHLMVGSDLEKSRKQVRNASIAGFAWSAYIFVVAVGFLIALLLSGDGGEGKLSLALFIFVVVEVGLVALLSFGVMRYLRKAAVALFFYFVISRLVLLAIGEIGFGEPQDLVRLLLQVIVGYFFFQGLRGVLTYYYLTHPQYPVAVDPSETSARVGAVVDGNESPIS